jgi:FKBP-type peptidyl-prolyl cis-trans isomerase FklB
MRLRFLIPSLCIAAGAAADQAPEPIDIGPAQPAQVQAQPADNDAEVAAKASYLIGWQMGQAVKEHDLVREQVLKGLAEGADGKPMGLPMDEAQKVMMAFQGREQKAQQAKQAKAGEEGAKRKDTNPAWLADNGKKPGVTTTKSGLQYRVIASGEPTAKQPTKDDQVQVNYTGKLLDGTVFDASERNGGPVTFGVGNVIPGWTEALQLMHEGDKWTLFIPSELAYGEHAPPAIGPNQILIFDVELLKVMPPAPKATP